MLETLWLLRFQLSSELAAFFSRFCSKILRYVLFVGFLLVYEQWTVAIPTEKRASEEIFSDVFCNIANFSFHVL